jgi:hypothetical protein
MEDRRRTEYIMHESVRIVKIIWLKFVKYFLFNISNYIKASYDLALPEIQIILGVTYFQKCWSKNFDTSHWTTCTKALCIPLLNRSPLNICRIKITFRDKHETSFIQIIRLKKKTRSKPHTTSIVTFVSWWLVLEHTFTENWSDHTWIIVGFSCFSLTYRINCKYYVIVNWWQYHRKAEQNYRQYFTSTTSRLNVYISHWPRCTQ